MLYNYLQAKRKHKRYLMLLETLEAIERLAFYDPESSTKYTDEQWQRYEKMTYGYFSDIVRDLRNRDFLNDYREVFEMLIRLIRDRQEDHFIMKAEWNDIFNRFEYVLRSEYKDFPVRLEAGALCPACKRGELVLKHTDMPFKHVTIHGQPSFHCPVCKESFCNKDINRKLESIWTVVRKEL